MNGLRSKCGGDQTTKRACRAFERGEMLTWPGRSTQSPDAANLVVCLQGPRQRPAQTPAGRRPSTGCQSHCS